MGYHGNINNKRFCNLTIVYGNAEINYEQHAFRELDNWKLWLICLQFILSFLNQLMTFGEPFVSIWWSVQTWYPATQNCTLEIPRDPSRSLEFGMLNVHTSIPFV